jgi:hypothetical protein
VGPINIASAADIRAQLVDIAAASKRQEDEGYQSDA